MTNNIILPEDFYKKVEEPDYLHHILYGDTDSLFICLPIKDAKTLSTEELINITDLHATKINDLSTSYIENSLLEKCNIDKKHNYTYFKTESIMESMIFLDVKKVYGYKVIIENGEYHMAFDYKGFPMRRSDYSKFTQDLLREIIEEVILNSSIQKDKKYDIVIDLINTYKNKFKKCIETFDYSYIGIPKKWSKVDGVINGMLLYNLLLNKKLFTTGSSGKMIYCILKNKNIFKDKIDVEKTKTICVPYKYDINLLKEQMEKHQIIIDSDKQWSTIYNKTCQRIQQLTKEISGRNILNILK